MHLVEPQRGIQLVLSMNHAMINSGFRSYLIPILADIFVFTYPIYLVALYSMGWFRKQISYKVAAGWIFANVAITTLVNIGVQFLVEKSRPNIVLGLVDEKTETILHKFLPTSSFPSDHAAVSMSIAVASILRGIQKKDKKYIVFGRILMSFSIIMSISRVTTAIHRPTDILGGTLIGILIPLILSFKKISSFGEKIFGWIGKKI